MNKTKGVAALVFAAALMMGLTTAAYAVTYDDPISSVSVNFDYELASGMGTNDIDVTCDTDGVDSIVVSSIANTTYGKRPTVTVKIKADTHSGYYLRQLQIHLLQLWLLLLLLIQQQLITATLK